MLKRLPEVGFGIVLVGQISMIASLRWGCIVSMFGMTICTVALLLILYQGNKNGTSSQ